jgi:hypothetical protein
VPRQDVSFGTAEAAFPASRPPIAANPAFQPFLDPAKLSPPKAPVVADQDAFALDSVRARAALRSEAEALERHSAESAAVPSPPPPETTLRQSIAAASEDTGVFAPSPQAELESVELDLSRLRNAIKVLNESFQPQQRGQPPRDQAEPAPAFTPEGKKPRFAEILGETFGTRSA